MRMGFQPGKQSLPRGLHVLLWITRIVATLIVAFLVIMMVGYAIHPQGNPATPTEAVQLAFFPIGMCVGYLVAWRWQLTGGIISTVSIVVFMALIREAYMVALLSILGVPGILFILLGLSARRPDDPGIPDQQ